MSTAYNFENNNTGRTLTIDFSTEWDNEHFFAVTVTDELSGEELMCAVSADPLAVQRFFEMVDEAKLKWEARE